jgi:hypothetical protein
MGVKNEDRSDGTAISLNLIGIIAAETLYIERRKRS